MYGCQDPDGESSSSCTPCMIFDFLASKEVSEAAAKNAMGGVYIGKAFTNYSGILTYVRDSKAKEETTSSVLHTLILITVLHPEVQAKVHAEIDAVAGQGMVTTLSYSLTLTDAYASGIPHATTRSDTHEGYYIPKVDRAMTRNCTDPHHFDPDRFMLPGGHFSSQSMEFTLLFGFEFVRDADDAMWAVVATILSALGIDKAKGALGSEASGTSSPHLVSMYTQAWTDRYFRLEVRIVGRT
ncbi:hypothetical protein BS17DRAFT_818514 [Gyrodon lividus]|nr:hypothetical protein BS17DRAFT_818514 [Gyrodon lividus]